jgi:ribonuclease HI
MNITIEKLSQRIIKHIKAELYALQELGDLKFLVDPKHNFILWENTIQNMLRDAVDGNAFEAFFDGSATPNPGTMKIGGYFKGESSMYKYSTQLGYGTNNEAEYNSLLYLVDLLNEKGIQKVNIYGDSQLVVNQVNGVWKARDDRMKKFKGKIIKELSKIPQWTLSHVPRDKNKLADSLT